MRKSFNKIVLNNGKNKLFRYIEYENKTTWDTAMAERILVIEDDSKWRDQLSDVLFSERRLIDSASNIQDATYLLGKNNYDLVVADVCLAGDSSGFNTPCQNFFTYFSSYYRTTPLITISGIIEDADLRKLIRIGGGNVRGILSKKDFSYAELRSLAVNVINDSWQETEKPASIYSYDAFISYSHALEDKKWVRNKLVKDLEMAGLKICIDYRDFRAGGFILMETERAVKNSRKTVIILSDNFLTGKWGRLESIFARTLEPFGENVIPVLFKQCKLEQPPHLRSLISIDLTKPHSRKEQIQKLIQAIRL